jgi:hypothetical protein
VGRGTRATRQGGGSARGAFGRRSHRRGGFHGAVARPKGNGGEGRRLVVAVDSLWFEKVAGAWEVIGMVSAEQEDNQ